MRDADQLDASEINWVELPGDDEDDQDDRNINQDDGQKHDDDQHADDAMKSWRWYFENKKKEEKSNLAKFSFSAPWLSSKFR